MRKQDFARILIWMGWASGGLFLAMGAWDLFVSGAHKLIIFGTLTLMLAGMANWKHLRARVID